MSYPRFRQYIKRPGSTPYFHYWGFGLPDMGNGFTSALLHFESEQFTGLFDRDGREIYEGDIVKFSLHHNNSSVIADVTFTECSFMVHYWKSKTVENWVSLPLNIEDQESVEVIGNIHENKELLPGGVS
jgi:uncharacterized phage protein (TIGR01671 family)